VLVTDAIVAAELGPGVYSWGGGQVEVSPAGRASRPGEPNLAGSVLTLDRAVINAWRHCGLSFETAWAMASTQPAALVGLASPEHVHAVIEEDSFQSVMSNAQ
jgi:N-acetylglucosamine-6-phosphate deacetylase